MKLLKLILALMLALSITVALLSCEISLNGKEISVNPDGDITVEDPETEDETDNGGEDETDKGGEDEFDESTKEDTDKKCEHRDDDGNRRCDECGERVFFEYTDPSTPSTDNSADVNTRPDSHMHFDFDEDFVCDECGKHAADDHEYYDYDGNAVCDMCWERYLLKEETHNHFDGDDDLQCDECGKLLTGGITLPEGTLPEITLPDASIHVHVDANGDKRCDNCGKLLGDITLPDTSVHVHVDADGDRRCDNCGIADPNFSFDVVVPENPGMQTHIHNDLNCDGYCDNCKTPMVNDFIDTRPDMLTKYNPHLEKTDFVYDGISITYNFVNLPDGCSLYSNPDECIVDAGTYTVEFRLEHPDYKSYTFTEVITVHKADYDMSDVKFEDCVYDFDGSPKDVFVWGNIPHGLEVTYTGNGVVTSGTHYVTAHFKGDEKNYNPVPDMTAKIVIGPHYKVYFDTTLANIEIAPEMVGIGAYYMPDNLKDIYGYTFIGWYLDDEPWYGAEPINSDIMLTAKWQLNEYRIVYFTNGGENSKYNPETYSIETLDVILEAAEHESLKFDGWYLDEQFTVKIERITDLSLTHFAVYAKWVEATDEEAILPPASITKR